MQFNLDECKDYEPAIIEAVLRVIRNKKYILSSEGAAFESEWAAYHGLPYAIGVGSGTDALRIALLALGVKPGDEVITPAFNVAYTAQAVRAIGAKNIYVDVEPDTMLMDLQKVQDLITPKTRAIVPVHLFGRMVDMKTVAAIARRHNLLVVEDAAQAHGSNSNSEPPGKFSDAACYSHYPTKNLGALGEAGSIVTKHPLINERARLLRDAGRIDRYIHVVPGINSCLDEIHAAVLRTKLPFLASSNVRRWVIAEYYTSNLRGVGDIRFQKPSGSHVYHLFVIRTKRRDELMRYLNNLGIPALSHYPCILPNQPFEKSEALGQGPFPVAEQCANEVLSLPMYPDLTGDDQNWVIESIKAFYAA